MCSILGNKALYYVWLLCHSPTIIVKHITPQMFMSIMVKMGMYPSKQVNKYVVKAPNVKFF